MKARYIPFLILVAFILTACGAVGTSQSSSNSPAITGGASPSHARQVSEQLDEETRLPTPRPRRLNAGELALATDKDAIPAIFATNNLFVDAARGSEEWKDDEPVIGVIINDEARAYPIRLLSLHEIVNDEIGDVPVAVTWCPLCYTAIVFVRTVDGRELTFGVSGYLYRNNLVMYDHQTNTLWSQVLAQGLFGAQRKQPLSLLPSMITAWGLWKSEYPQTTILSAAGMELLADDIIDPYAGYYVSEAAGLLGSGEVDARLPPKSLVIGIRIGKTVRAYSVEEIRRAGLIQDQIDEYPVLLIWDETLQTVLSYHNEIERDARTLALIDQDGFMRDRETGSIWDIHTGTAIEGPLTGKMLPPISAPLVFWFAWSDLYPTTELYSAMN